MFEQQPQISAQGGGYGPPPGGFGAPPGGFGAPPGGGYGAPGGMGAPPAGFPPPGGMSPMAPPGGGPMAGGGPGDANAELKAQLDKWFIISIVVVVFCCSCWPLGAAGIYMIHSGKGLLAQGNAAGAEEKLKTGKTLTLVAAGLGALLMIVSIILNVVSAMSANSF